MHLIMYTYCVIRHTVCICVVYSCKFLNRKSRMCIRRVHVFKHTHTHTHTHTHSTQANYVLRVHACACNPAEVAQCAVCAGPPGRGTRNTRTRARDLRDIGDMYTTIRATILYDTRGTENGGSACSARVHTLRRRGTPAGYDTDSTGLCAVCWWNIVGIYIDRYMYR
jgi:hypothetical protein